MRHQSLSAASRLIALSATLFTIGCGPSGPKRQVINVYAASSLTESFQELERVFEAADPATDVVLTLAGSQILRLQIEQGGAANIFASANSKHMRALIDSGIVRSSRIFAQNELIVIVPADNPAAIAAFSDLPRASRLIIGTENVPVGRYTREALRQAAIQLGVGFDAEVLAQVASEETNVRLIRAKVELGEADAAIVYRTDAQSSDRVHSISIPAEMNIRAEYSIGIVDGSENQELAGRWLDLVFSGEGQRILAAHGFVVVER